jgi:hypothetical protein
VNRLWNAALNGVHRFSSGLRSGDWSPFHDGNVVLGQEIEDRTSFVTWSIVLHEDKGVFICNLDGFTIIREFQDIINQGKQSIVQNIFILVCSDPSFITDNQWAQSIASETRPHHHPNMFPLECFLNILGIEPFAWRADHPLTTGIDVMNA